MEAWPEGMTVEEAAEMLGMTTRTVRRYMASGRIRIVHQGRHMLDRTYLDAEDVARIKKAQDLVAELRKPRYSTPRSQG
jgi:excisionase family DNA binding protein